MDTSSDKMVSLNESNYQVWKRKMGDILYVKDHLHLRPVFSDKKPNEKTDIESELYYKKVLGLRGYG